MCLSNSPTEGEGMQVDYKGNMDSYRVRTVVPLYCRVLYSQLEALEKMDLQIPRTNKQTSK